jgi:hypothetical protein
MRDYLNLRNRDLPWPAIIRSAFIIVFTLLLFLLAHSMVKHRFFRGGWMNQNNSLQP